MARLKDYYNNEVIPKLMKDGHYRNVMQVSRLEKIVLNMGVGEAVSNPKSLTLLWLI